MRQRACFCTLFHKNETPWGKPVCWVSMRMRRTVAQTTAALALAVFLSASVCRAQKIEVTVTPAEVENGSPVLVHVEAEDGASVEGEWLGRKIEFFPARRGNGWLALAGVDVKQEPGPSTLHITVRSAGETYHLSRAIQIHPAHYRASTLSVPPRFVSPGPAQLRRIETERKLKDAVFAVSATRRLWSGAFHLPVNAQPTDSFGTRRIFNGQLASIHEGMDFHARTGTRVRASNSGVVVLARPLYYEGNCVVIDHGLGLFTLSMHLSRIYVREGQRVTTGQRLGLSGATGRVTGPHLHWAVRWQGAYLDPARLLRLPLDQIR